MYHLMYDNPSFPPTKTFRISMLKIKEFKKLFSFQAGESFINDLLFYSIEDSKEYVVSINEDGVVHFCDLSVFKKNA